MCPAFETCQSRSKVLSGELKGEISLLPQSGQFGVADIDGCDLDPSTGPHHPQDSLHTDTLLGELADQPVSPAGYALDEIARHRDVPQTVPKATEKPDLSEQPVAFLMSPLGFAVGRVRLVALLTQHKRVITPTGETEVTAIVHHCLSAHVPNRRISTIPSFQKARRAFCSLALVVCHNVHTALASPGAARTSRTSTGSAMRFEWSSPLSLTPRYSRCVASSPGRHGRHKRQTQAEREQV